MPINADRIGENQSDEAGVAAGVDAATANALVSPESGGVPGGGPSARLRGIARRLRAGQDAATTVEYALMLLLVSSLVLAVTTMTTSLTGALGRAARALN